MRKYRLVAKKGEGTFSEVLKAQNVKDGRYHAIKCMKNKFESIDQVNNLREIQALRRLSPHDNIITLEEVLYDQPTGRLALVFELMDANLYELIRGRRHYLNPALIKSYMWQLMKSLDHMHRKGIFHRDIKPENILIENSSELGRGLKLADLGSCRGIYSKQPYTEYISTRWYRAPECLLTDGYYGPEMDMWGAGCVFFEITSLYPLFPGSNEVDQIARIHKVLGTPSTEIIQKLKSKGASHINFDFPPQKAIGIPQLVPHAGPEATDLMVKMIKYDVTERMSAREALRHPYFRDIRDQEQRRNSANEGKGVEGEVKTVKAAKSEMFSSSGVSGATQNTDVLAEQKPNPKSFPDIAIQAKPSASNLSMASSGALPPIGQAQTQLQGAALTGKLPNNTASNKAGGGGGAVVGGSIQQQQQQQQIALQQQQQQLQQQLTAQLAAAQKKKKKGKTNADSASNSNLGMVNAAGTQPMSKNGNASFTAAEPKAAASSGNTQGRTSKASKY